ncbi:hypothetical protein [Gilliamella sp. ESL0405]|uniref:hypothetical protein n=1 Tax=Gilliamella sp. ESL0405 TaxID=2704653 RepID=UPI001C69E61B|nr:hypothetical protein [Gilliamella sp. ESL0405]QYN47546.1 hypothetical protein GYM74_10215 [Gilliamella sp. ESL0405]
MNQTNNNQNLNNQSSDTYFGELQSNTKPPLLISILIKLRPFSMIWVSMVLMYGVICMYTNGLGQDEFYRFIFFLRSPLAVIINCLALFVMLFHCLSWFNLLPNAIFSPSHHNKAKIYLITLGLWLIMIAISACLLWLVLK